MPEGQERPPWGVGRPDIRKWNESSRQCRLTFRARCGGNRFCPDPLGSLRCAGRGKRDGKPVPYEGVRYCADVSKEFVGEAFRLPAGSAGIQFVLGADVVVTALTRSVRYIEGVRFCANVPTEFVGEAFRLPRGGTQAAPYGPQCGLTKRARCGCNRYRLRRSVRYVCADRGKRDGLYLF